jgi:hypothetical protein
MNSPFRALMQEPIAGLATYVDESDGSEIPALVLPADQKIPLDMSGVAWRITCRDDPNDETTYLAVDVLNRSGLMVSPTRTILLYPISGPRLQKQGRLLLVDRFGGFLVVADAQFRRAVDAWMKPGWVKRQQPP